MPGMTPAASLLQPGRHLGGGGTLLPLAPRGLRGMAGYAEAQGREAHWGPPGGAPPASCSAPAGRPGRPGGERGGQCGGPAALGGPSLTIFPLFVFLNLGGPNSCRIP